MGPASQSTPPSEASPRLPFCALALCREVFAICTGQQEGGSLMTYMKFHQSQTPRGDYVLARLFAGPTEGERRYAGTLVLPAQAWEKFLDCLVFGAAQMQFDGEKLNVFFGPDDGGG